MVSVQYLEDNSQDDASYHPGQKPQQYRIEDPSTMGRDGQDNYYESKHDDVVTPETDFLSDWFITRKNSPNQKAKA